MRSVLHRYSKYRTSTAKRPVSGYTSFVIDVRQIVGENANSAATKAEIDWLFVILRAAMKTTTDAAIEKSAESKFKFLIGSPGNRAKK